MKNVYSASWLVLKQQGTTTWNDKTIGLYMPFTHSTLQFFWNEAIFSKLVYMHEFWKELKNTNEIIVLHYFWRT